MKVDRQRVNKGHGLNLKYAITLIASIMLLAAAIMGPQVLFYVQDNYRMGKNWKGQRNSLDFEAINNAYGSLRERLSKYADGLSREKEYYVAERDCKVTEEVYDILEETFNQELFKFYEEWGLEWGLQPYSFHDGILAVGYNVEKWKNYVVYDDFFGDGETTVVVMAWYIELVISNNIRLKLLTDSESNTIYYMQYIYEWEESENTQMDVEFTYYYLSMLENGLLYDLPLYCNSYYDAGEVTEYAYKSIYEQMYYREKTDDNLELVHNLDYDGKVLHLEFGTRSLKDESSILYMGIEEIAELISELQN